jgi:alpha-beta hydrolase superfamily lysophospholipase
VRYHPLDAIRFRKRITSSTNLAGESALDSIESRHRTAHNPPMPEGQMSYRSEASFAASDGMRLFSVEDLPRRASGPRSLICLMHGFAEHCGRYDAVAAHFAARGHAVCRFDARGHGRSGGRRGYVRDFDDYVDDFAAFTRDALGRYPGAPLIAFGHSNGGLIALRAVQRGLLAPSALVLTSPLLRLRKRPVPDPLARFLSWAAPGLPLPNGINRRDLTHDPELLAAHAADALVHKVATPRWYWSMTRAARLAFGDAPRLSVPLLIVCGELDPIVDPAGAVELHALAGSPSKELIVRAGEFHEVLNETRRSELHTAIAGWIERALETERAAAG